MQRLSLSARLPGMVETGVFLIADISGYTEYLARSDLRHGPVIASDLLTTVVEAMRARFTINKLEGDAVFTFSSDPGLTGGELIDVIDSTYLAFRRRLLSVSQATTCGCPSCGLMPQLDLKLIAHAGEFSRQLISGLEELAGRDVIVVHRLLKHSLGMAGSGTGRILLTDACVRRLHIDPSALQLEAHTERFPHLGEVPTWAGDLSSRFGHPWEPAGTILHEATASFPSAPATVWNALAPGRSESCVTDRLATVHQVLDWRPFEMLVVEIEVSGIVLNHQVLLDSSGDVTSATICWYEARRTRKPASNDMSTLLARITEKSLRSADQQLRQPV